MTDESDLPLIDTHQDGQTQPVATLDAITTLIHSFASMMTAMEARLSMQIKDNATASKERWAAWEKEFRHYRESTDERIGILEKSVHDHTAEAERRQIASDARRKPVLSLIGWAWENRRDLVILIIAVLTVLGLLEQLSFHQ